MPQPIGQEALVVAPGYNRKSAKFVCNKSAETIMTIGSKFYAQVSAKKREKTDYLYDTAALISIDTTQQVLCRGESVFNRAKLMLDASMFPKKDPLLRAVSDDCVFAGLSIALDVTGTTSESSLEMDTTVTFKTTLTPLPEKWSQSAISDIAKREHIIFKIPGRQSGMQPLRRVSGSGAIVKNKSDKKKAAANAIIEPLKLFGDDAKYQQWCDEGRKLRVHMQFTYNKKAEKSTTPVFKLTNPDIDNSALGAVCGFKRLPPFAVRHLTAEKRVCKTPILESCTPYNVSSITEECSLIYICPMD